MPIGAPSHCTHEEKPEPEGQDAPPTVCVGAPPRHCLLMRSYSRWSRPLTVETIGCSARQLRKLTRGEEFMYALDMQKKIVVRAAITYEAKFPLTTM
ncbi:hypothetical protein V3C99_018395 [Haemonchus contortus]|uniref:Uncharacterized protein n=1 Tax=Haemonchus contortus TaxID=6289 RepID=A0A7I4Z523_HAECO